MFKYTVRLVRNGIGFDLEVMAKHTYEAKEVAERIYPTHKAIRAIRVYS